MSQRLNPMTDELTEKQEKVFAIETLAHNLIAGGLAEDDIPYVSYIFRNHLESFFEKREYNQTS